LPLASRACAHSPLASRACAARAFGPRSAVSGVGQQSGVVAVSEACCGARTSATQRRTLPLGAFALPSCACTRAPTRGAPTSSSLPATSPVGDVGSQPTSTSSPFEGEYRCPSAPVRVVL